MDRYAKELDLAAEKYSNYGMAQSGFISGARWEQYRDKWISVNNGMPTYKDGLVNVRCRNKNKEDGIFLYDVCYIDEDTGVWGKRSHTWEEITHWMPIPE